MKEAAEKNILKLTVMHGDAKEEAKYIFDELKKIKRIKDIGFGEVGPVIGVHTGPGVVGLVFYPGLED